MSASRARGSSDMAGRLKVGLTPGPRLTFTWNGEEVQAHDGESVAVALLAAGERSLRTTKRRHDRRGIFCGIGVCYDCLVVVNGVPNLRACVTAVVDGMEVTS